MVTLRPGARNGTPLNGCGGVPRRPRLLVVRPGWSGWRWRFGRLRGFWRLRRIEADTAIAVGVAGVEETHVLGAEFLARERAIILRSASSELAISIMNIGGCGGSGGIGGSGGAISIT